MAIVMQGTSYSGTHASQYWMPAYFEADTIKAGVVSIWDGIKDKVNISTMVFTGTLQPREATPTTPIGTATVSEKILEPMSAMLWLTYNPSVLENQWESVALSTYMLDRNLPNDFASYFMYSVMSVVFGQNMEVGWWMSSTAYQGVITDPTDPRYYLQFCDGFMKLIVNDATVLNYASPAAITTSNILTFLDGLIDLITANKKGLLGRSSMKFFFSQKTKNIWRKYLLAPTFKGIEYKQTGDNVYAGYDIVTLNGFPDDTILFCEGTKDMKGAFHIGMNSTSDENNIQIERTRWMDETYGMKALMKFNTQIKLGNEIACMTTLVAADFTA